MASYESIYIIHPDTTEDKLAALHEKLKGVLAKNGAEIKNIEDWGKRKLAYKINKQHKGFYTLINFEGPPASIAEFERIMKVTDEIIKYMTVKLAKDEVARLGKRIAARSKAEAGKDDIIPPEPESPEEIPEDVEPLEAQ